MKGCFIVKKYFLLIGMLFIFLFAETSFAYNPYPTHLGDDNNYILCDGHMGAAWYVDRSSLVAQAYNPPYYKLAINVVYVPKADRGGTNIANVRTYHYYYDLNNRNMYSWDGRMDYYYYLDPNGSWAATGIRMPAGEIAFVLAYNMKFYGNHYDRDFYNRI